MRQEEISGIGLGFRFPHAFEVLRTRPTVPWFEVIADDLLLPSGRQGVIDKVRRDYPIVLHGVGLNIAGSAPIDEWYLDRWLELDTRYAPAWFSDHLCWSSSPGRQHFDLLPIPWSQSMLEHVVSRVAYVQERLGRPVVLENISYYTEYQDAQMTEWQFLGELTSRTGCKVLLDLNNLWINATNFERDPRAQLAEALGNLGPDAVSQIHLAGGKAQASAGASIGSSATNNQYWVDTHGEPVISDVVLLYRQLCELMGPTPAMIERDFNLPPFTELELERQAIADSVADVQALPREVECVS